MKRGFTVVEVLVTLVVIAILLGLGTVGLRSTLVNGRDSERRSDIETIARGLEIYYERGNPYVIGAVTKNTYPGSGDFQHLLGRINECTDAAGRGAAYYPTNKCQIGKDSVADALPGVSASALTPPGADALPQQDKIHTSWWNPDTTLTAWANEGYYIYRPFKPTNDADPNGPCNHDCPRYELWYKEESSGQIIKVRSKRQ